MMFCNVNYKLKSKFFLALCLIFSMSLCAPIFAETLTVGGKQGWEHLALRNGVTETNGRYGYSAITLATNSQTADVYTDMLLDFDNENVRDKTGNYKVVSNYLQSTSQSVMGNGAALSRKQGGVVLEGKYGSLFGTAGTVGSFTISFWLSPSSASSGEVIFNWRSSRTGYSAVAGGHSQFHTNYTRAESVNYQQITASFVGGKIEWSFFNVFDGAEKLASAIANDGDIRITGTTPVIPSRWSYHVISFNEETGLLEYRVNGNIEALTYVTTNERGSGYVYPLYFGAPSEVEICPAYIGKMDDFKIERKSYDVDAGEVSDATPEIVPSIYRVTGGRIETQPLLTTAGSTLNKITAEMSVPEQTAVRLYVRSGDTYFNWTEDEPAWMPISSGEKIEGVSGRYFQIAADLYPDGSGKVAPVVTDFTVDYTPPQSPLPPFTVKAVAGNGSVNISWSDSVDDIAGGYYVYYGIRPGEYLGRMAVQGASPVNVGNTTSVTLTGLKNNTIYYFAIAAWSSFDERIVGQLSKEVYARPSVR